jgi:DNA-directed RNA polymerase II subunit RPB2
MELECMWGHGTMYFLKERFMECSDEFLVCICNECGMIEVANVEKNVYMCKMCKNITDFSRVLIPYTAKLLIQEIMTMSIAVRLQVSKLIVGKYGGPVSANRVAAGKKKCLELM